LKFAGLVTLLLLILIAATVWGLGIGAVPISPVRVARILASGPPGTHAVAAETIIWNLRLPRVLLAASVGAGLAASGAGYQGLFRNPLADPYVIGASSGAAVGATLAIIGGLALVPVAALAGSLASVGAVYAIANIGRQVPAISLLLAGVTVSSLLGSIVALLMFLHHDQLLAIFNWLMGSLQGKGWDTLYVTAPLIAAGSGFLWLQSRGLDALTFGEESATSLGLDMRWLQMGVVIAASIATAASVYAGGIIGFVGLVAPHVARLMFGARHAQLIPASALLGAILLLLSDNLARWIMAPQELPVGIITALLGSPFLLFLLKTRQREWRTGA
jgi:iron complex transport system permease protein